MRTLSITIEDKLYNSLKQNIPSRQISKFVSEALSDKLEQEHDKLYKAYLEASRDTERENSLSEWDALSLEAWEKEDS